MLRSHRGNPYQWLAARLGAGRLARAWRRSEKRPLVALLVCGATSFLTVVSLRPGSTYQEGDLARSDIRAAADIAWVDEPATDLVRAQARRAAAKAYSSARGEAARSMLERAATLFDAIEATAIATGDVAEAESVPPAESAESSTEGPGRALRAVWTRLADVDRIFVSYRGLSTLASLPLTERSAVRAATTQALLRINDEHDLRSDEPDLYRSAVRTVLAEYAERGAFGLPPGWDAREAFADAAAACVVPNLNLDEKATEEARTRAAESVRPVLAQLKRGELVVTRNQPLSADDIQKLRMVGATRAAREWPQAVWMVIFIFAGLTAGGLLLHALDPASLHGARHLGVLSGLLVLSTAVLNVSATTSASHYVTYGLGLFCAIAGSLLLGMAPVVVLAPALLLVASLILGPGDITGLANLLVGVAAGMVLARRLSYSLTQALPVGLLAGAVVFGSTHLTSVVYRESAAAPVPLDFLHTAPWCLLSGVVAVLAGHIGIRYLEQPLRTVTEMRLLELSDPRQPVLQELLAKAPGTYHGSLAVSGLAGNACDAAGLSRRDVLLARIGGMYHDIGKLRRPHMFVENQHGGHNPHDGMLPALSARTVMAHVSDGLELAQIHRLPGPISDCIREHHGTTLIGYFYQRSLEMGEEAEEARFRYPGPRPRSAVTGILMLADGSEAAVRAAKEPTRQAIEETVSRIVRSRLEDGQLDDCPLTIRQIHVIEASFVQTLLGLYHARIEYPAPPGGSGNGGPRHG